MNLKTLLPAFVLALGLSVPAQAHEFIVKITPEAPQKGVAATAEFMASHVFTESDEMEDPKDIKATLIQNGQSSDLAVKANPAAKDVLAEFTVAADSPVWLVGHRLPQLWSQTPDGILAGDKNTLTGKKILYTNQYEKFVKVLLNPSSADNSFSQPIGQTLEIVPLDNPAGIKIGDEIRVKVLYNGQPVAVPVYASYMGFSDQQNTYAYYTEPEEGDPVVKVTAKGMWLIRANYKVSGTGDIKTHDLKAIMQFVVD
jgi:ABC-type Co2+ transport system, periplasmic component